MASYYISQEYDVPSVQIWAVLTDFASWPMWFPNLTEVRLPDGVRPAPGVELHAVGASPDEWVRWRVVEWDEPQLLMCEHVDSTIPLARGVQAAYLLFELTDDDEGCRLDVEVGAEGDGLLGDFLVGTTLGMGARRLLPQLVDAFSEHVVRQAASSR